VEQPESDPQQHLSAPDFLADVMIEFGLGNRIISVERFAGGSAGCVWRLTTDLGTWAVKQTSAVARDPAWVSDSTRFERVAWEQGVPMPEPRLSADGAPISLVGSEPSTGILTVREWIDGSAVRWDESLQEREAAALLLSRGLARLHQIDWAATGLDSGWWSASPGPARWQRLTEMGRDRQSSWAEGIDCALPRLLAAEEIVAMPVGSTSRCMCHRDPNPHNVLRARGSIFLIDWDSAGMAPPEQEMAGVLMNWACDGLGRPMDGLPLSMVAAYRAAGGTLVPRDLSIFSMHLIGWLKWIELQLSVSLGLLPDDPRDPRSAEQSVSDLFVWLQRVDALPLLLGMLQSA
jgi:Ser/Thr protein kinase RdoA (MazF antagonist)